MITQEFRISVGERRVRIVREMREEAGRSVLLTEEGTTATLTANENGLPSEILPEELCGAGYLLWKEKPQQTMQILCGDRSRWILCSERQGRLTHVTAEAGQPEFIPHKIPIRFEVPLIHDLVTLPQGSFRMTALRFGRPYAVLFPETVGDMSWLFRGEEIGTMHLFPQGAEVLFVYVQEESLLHLRVRHRDGSTVADGRDYCAALAAAVAVGKCRPERSVRFPLSRGEGRAVFTKDRTIFLTLPVFEDFA